MRVYRAFVNEIHWLDKESREAAARLTVDGSEITAFCHPCGLQEGQTFAVTFDGLEADESVDSILSGNPSGDRRLVPTGSSAWSYEALGRIKSVRPLIIDCGVIDLELFARFRDERLVGAYIRVGIHRLDVQLVHETDR